MLRILHVVTHMNRGGLETMLMNYYRHADRSLIQFDFLTHRDYDGDYGEEIKSLGGIIHHLPPLNPFSPAYLRALDGFFAMHGEYPIVHVHQDCMSSIILRSAKKNGVPVRIAHSHSSSQDKGVKYLIKLHYKKKIPKYATELMACGQDAGRWMFGTDGFKVIPNAVDAEAFGYDFEKRQAVRRSLGISEGELLAGHVGRFNYPKNHTFLVDVFNELAKRAPAKLLLVGGGELKAQTEDKVRSLGLSDRVIFAGYRSDIADLMQAMDVFVFPSNYEGLPVTVIEAQSAGLPCLISDKVPIECKITDLVEQIPLGAGAAHWADKAVKAAVAERRDTLAEIRSAGYDITQSAAALVEYYLKTAESIGR